MTSLIFFIELICVALLVISARFSLKLLRGISEKDYDLAKESALPILLLLSAIAIWNGCYFFFGSHKVDWTLFLLSAIYILAAPSWLAVMAA